MLLLNWMLLRLLWLDSNDSAHDLIHGVVVAVVHIAAVVPVGHDVIHHVHVERRCQIRRHLQQVRQAIEVV